MRTHVQERAPGRDRKRGVALIAVTLLFTVLAMLSLSLVGLNASSAREATAQDERISVDFAARAALSRAVASMRAGGTGALGSQDAPVDFGGGRYWVESVDLGDSRTSLVATGVDERLGSRLELVVRATAQSFFSWAAFGDEGMTMDSNARVDSYNSSLGSYDSQLGMATGDSNYANDQGNVGSNASIELSQNARVYGNATPGPAGSTTVLGNATVSGSTLPMTQVVELPPIDVPVIPVSGDLVLGGNNSQILPSGDHAFGSLSIGNNATLTIVGPATIVTTTMALSSNAEIIVNALDGPVDFFVVDDFILESNTTIASTTFYPNDIRFNLQSDNVINPSVQVDLDQLDFDSNARLFGTVYAPNAFIQINSNFELFGSLVSRRVHLDSNSMVHFDESLLGADQDGGVQFERVMLRRRAVPAAVLANLNM